MSEYGLPSVRDKDGELRPVEHTYEWGGEEVTIKLLPPTISQQERYEELGEDVDVERLREIVDTHLVKPDIPDDESLTSRELFCYLEGIVDYSVGGGDGMAAEVQAELEKRNEAQGN
jgi:hypothetical protein